MTSSPIPTWLTVRYGRHRVVPRVRVAAEHRPAYEAAGADAAVGTDASRADQLVPAGAGEGPAGEGPPFGLPVLAEVPELAAALAAFTSADDRMLEGILTVARLLATGEVEQTTGVGVEQWLGIVARQTRMDRRLLLRLCRLLGPVPDSQGGGRSAAGVVRAATRTRPRPAGCTRFDRW
jgi:hypothetical protein